MVYILEVAGVFLRKVAFKTLNWPIGPYPRTSIKDASKLELKALYSHLKYDFLGDNNTLPVILSAGLSDV